MYRITSLKLEIILYQKNLLKQKNLKNIRRDSLPKPFFQNFQILKQIFEFQNELDFPEALELI